MIRANMQISHNTVVNHNIDHVKSTLGCSGGRFSSGEPGKGLIPTVTVFFVSPGINKSSAN